MKIQKEHISNRHYLILKEGESLTIIAKEKINSSINIQCKNKKLLVTFIDMKKELPKKK